MIFFVKLLIELENGNTEKAKVFSSEVEIMVLEENGYFRFLEIKILLKRLLKLWNLWGLWINLTFINF